MAWVSRSNQEIRHSWLPSAAMVHSSDDGANAGLGDLALCCHMAFGWNHLLLDFVAPDLWFSMEGLRGKEVTS